MKIKRLSLIFLVIFIFMICIYFMNIHFDRLSRYPYDDENARYLIDKYMNDDQIEYIIEYSISPDIFIDYVKSPLFSVYHVEYYNQLKKVKPKLSDKEIVEYIESLLKINADMEKGIFLLQYSSLEDVIAYFKDKE